MTSSDTPITLLQNESQHTVIPFTSPMPVTTLSAAAYITPVVVKTFLEHGKRRTNKEKGSKDANAKDDIFFDEAFHIVKAFIELGTKNTVESLQEFTNTHVPAPLRAAVAPVLIPFSSCNHAADTLIEWFGPEELKQVVGGERWWQVRGLDGIDAEWIAGKEHLNTTNNLSNKRLDDEDATVLKMDHLETVMLYVHGGGYFWGSINTHRHQIIKYARKFKGRAFAVNYRKAPQYPWPCALQDVLAAYHYLTRPPSNASHRPVPASKIVLAGDSAGGGICVTVLTVLRDLGLPLPAGAVLISPWVDLTHSFSSVMENTQSDIIPQHGFLAKPSALWPVDPVPKEGARTVPTKTNPPPKPGDADTLKPSDNRVQGPENSNQGDGHAPPEVKTQAEMLHNVPSEPKLCNNEQSLEHSSDNRTETNNYDVDFWEPKPPKVLMDDPSAVPLELHSQIQIYALTEQLTHPLVSPILQGSLGNLPPLYILAGDEEVLRDEAVYLAHRAAHPSKYPVRHGVLRDGRRQKENAERFTKPTSVRLQVFDGMCHVLTVFSFTPSAKYAYRSIAEFVNNVTSSGVEDPKGDAFHPASSTTLSEPREKGLSPESNQKCQNPTNPNFEKSCPDGETFRSREASVSGEITSRTQSGHDNPNGGVENAYKERMIRERIDINGIPRPMEAPEKLSVLTLRPGQIGIIKEGPTRKWLKGQEEWDRVYRRSAEKAIKKRVLLEAKAKRMLDNARLQGLILDREVQPDELKRFKSAGSYNKTDRIQNDRRWGPLDLDDERPPPSAIAKRRDTPEAIALLKKSIYHTAPATHKTVPKQRVSDSIRAAFDPNDDPNKPPKQSVSEQQVRAHVMPVHGVRMWDGLLRYFGKETSKKALKGTKQVGEQLGLCNSDN